MEGQGPGERRRVPGPLAGLLLGALLGVSVFLTAAFLQDRALRRPSAGGGDPEDFHSPGDPRAAVRVLGTLPGPGVQALLLPLREDGGSPGSGAALLDAALFPAGPAHRWFRLLLANPPGGEAFTVVLDGGGLLLETGPGTLRSADLASAFEGRRGALSPHRLLDLRAAGAHLRSAPIPPGATGRFLVAFPAAADLAAATGLEIPGGLRLRPREVALEAVRTALYDGRIGALREAGGAEARAGEGVPR